MAVTPAASPDVWLILWPVIVGAALTLFPAVLGQLAVQFLLQSARQREKDREQFQLLAAGIAEFEQWMNARTDHKAYGAADPGPSPLPKVMAIAALDFPVLLEPLDAVSSASLQLASWQGKAAVRRLQGKIGEINDGFDEAYRPVLENMSHLNDELRVVGVSLHR